MVEFIIYVIGVAFVVWLLVITLTVSQKELDEKENARLRKRYELEQLEKWYDAQYRGRSVHEDSVREIEVRSAGETVHEFITREGNAYWEVRDADGDVIGYVKKGEEDEKALGRDQTAHCHDDVQRDDEHPLR